jgi:hypothetical protein
MTTTCWIGWLEGVGLPAAAIGTEAGDAGRAVSPTIEVPIERRKSAEIRTAPIAARTDGRHVLARRTDWEDRHSGSTNSRVAVVDGALAGRQCAFIGRVPDAE